MHACGTPAHDRTQRSACTHACTTAMHGLCACTAPNHTRAPRCLSRPCCPRSYAFTVHGLWPQRRDGTWPEFCTSTPLHMEVGRVLHDGQRAHSACAGVEGADAQHAYVWREMNGCGSS